MTNYNERLDEVLLTYKSAYQIAFNEVDPHGNNMSPYDGSKAVSERSRDIEAEAKQALKQLVADEMLELIGEDASGAKYDGGDPIDCDECGCYVDDEAPSCACDVQNMLKVELRAKLAEWKGDSNDQPE